MNNVIEQLRANLLTSQEVQQPASNLYRVPAPPYQVRGQVWLNSWNIQTQRPFRKLDNKWIGPFKVLELIGKHAYHLELPKTLWIQLVFHSSLLRPAAQDPILGQSNQPPGLVIGTDMDDLDVYKVKSIMDS